MRNPLAQFTLLALSSLSFTAAFNKLAVPSTIAANKTSTLTVTNDLSAGPSGFDSSYSNFRTYLAIAVPGADSGPACWLVNSSSINTTSVHFLIPPTVGPDGSSYSIATMEFNSNQLAISNSNYEYSSDFVLTNGTGSWSAAELAGQTIGNPDDLPCTAYNCARNCTQTFYPANTTDVERQSYECTAACPGATFVTWATALEEDCQAANAMDASSICALASSASSSASVAATHTVSPSTTTSSSFSATSNTATPTKSSSAHRIDAVQVTFISTMFAGVFVAFGI